MHSGNNFGAGEPEYLTITFSFMSNRNIAENGSRAGPQC